MKRVLLFLLAVALVGCSSGTSKKAAAPKDHTVVYKIKSDSINLSVRYDNESGGTNEETVKGDWSKTIKVKPGGYVFMSANNEDEYSKELSAEILVDGKPFQKSEANKKYGGVTVSGYLDQEK